MKASLIYLKFSYTPELLKETTAFGVVDFDLHFVGFVEPEHAGPAELADFKGHPLKVK